MPTDEGPTRFLKERYAEARCRLPRYVFDFLLELEPILSDQGAREEAFFDFMRGRKIHKNSITRIYGPARRLSFPDVPKRKNVKELFHEQPIRPKHQRVFKPSDMEHWLHYLKDPKPTRALALYASGILLSIYTGFRMITISQLMTSHLARLFQKERHITLPSKGGQFTFTINYFPELCETIRVLVQLQEDQLNLLNKTGVDTYLFSEGSRGSIKATTQVISAAFNLFFNEAFGRSKPYGFGLHSCRYYIAGQFAMAGRIEDARVMLGHSDIRTTKRYTRDFILNEIQENLVGTLHDAEDGFRLQIKTESQQT